MSAIVLLGILIVFTIYRFYKNKNLFMQLTINEWIKYIFSLILSVGVAVGIIFSLKNVINYVSIMWLKLTLQILLIFLTLLIAGFIFSKTVPEKIKKFYDL